MFMAKNIVKNVADNVFKWILIVVLIETLSIMTHNQSCNTT